MGWSRQFAALVLIVACAFALTWRYVPMPAGWPLSPEAAGWLLVVVIGHWIVVAAHEIGHAGFGLSSGLTLKQIAVGPLLIDWSRGETRLRRKRGVGHSGFVRIVGAELGPISDRELRANVWMAIGGPITGAMVAIVVLEIGWLYVAEPSWLRTGLIAAGCWGVFLNVVNLIPLRQGLARTDGSWVMSLCRDRACARELMAAARWVDLVHSRVAPGAWPPELVAEQEAALFRPEPLSDDQIDLAIMAGNLLYYHYADREEWIEANHVITRAADLPRPVSPKPRPNSRFEPVDVMHAVHLALRGRNALAGRAALGRIHPRSLIRKNSLFVGAEAAIALAEGDATRAIELATRARNVLAPSLAFSAADQVEDGWWVTVLARAGGLQGGGTAGGYAFPSQTACRAELFAWDPGLPSDLRTVFIWRRPPAADFERALEVNA